MRRTENEKSTRLLEIESTAKLCDAVCSSFSVLPCCVLVLLCMLPCQRIPVSVPWSFCVCVTLSIRLARKTLYCLDGTTVSIWSCILAAPLRPCAYDCVLFTNVAVRMRIRKSTPDPPSSRTSVGEDDVVVNTKHHPGVRWVWMPDVRVFGDGAVGKSG